MILMGLSGLIDPFFHFFRNLHCESPFRPLSNIRHSLNLRFHIPNRRPRPPNAPPSEHSLLQSRYRPSSGNPPTLDTLSDTDSHVEKNRHGLLKRHPESATQLVNGRNKHEGH